MEVALQETNSDQQTILHLALLHRMPDKIILLIVRFMKLEDINKRDSTNRCALDYLVSKTIKAYTLKVDQCECNLPTLHCRMLVVKRQIATIYLLT